MPQQAAGGLLFRCEMCANSYCEDHLPPEAQVIVNCVRFQNFGQAQPKQAREEQRAVHFLARARYMFLP